jgi:hypothetical protein
MVECVYCGGRADPGWETCGSCDIEQQQLEEELEHYRAQYEKEQQELDEQE